LLLVLACLVGACKRSQGPISVSDQSNIPRPPPSEHVEEFSVRCYAGTSLVGSSEADLLAAAECTPGAEDCLGQPPVLVRRSSRPAESTIVEEWVDGATPVSYPTTSVVTMTITDDRFELDVVSQVNPRGAESEHEPLSWTGAGELVGDPWRWTGATAKHARQPPITDVVTTRIEDDALYRETAYTLENGSIVLRRRDQLHEFSCAEWDARRDALGG